VEIFALVVSPTDSNTVYAGTTNGVFKSTDLGRSWVAASDGLTTEYVYSNMAIDLRDPNTLYVGTNGGGLFKTVNGAQSWAHVETGGHQTVKCVAIDSNNSNIVYSGSFVGFYKSVDGGVSWTTLSSFPGRGAFSILIDPNNSNVVYVGSDFGLEKSSDGGFNWTTVLSVGLVSALVLDPTQTSTIYAGGSNGTIYKSINSGASWTPVLSEENSNVYALAMDPSDPQTIYAGFSYAGGVYKTVDGGNTWSEADSGLISRYIQALAVDSQNPQTLYAGTSAFSVWQSDNGAQSWH